MNKTAILILATILLTSFGLAYSQTPTIVQIDTIAIKGMPLQPVLKISINVPNNSYSLKKLVIKSYCEDFLDVDSVAIYRTKYNRFSAADLPDDWSHVALITKRKSISVTDSLVSFSNLSYPLKIGDNFIWIFLDLSKQSIAGHSLKVSIPKDSIIINTSKYPATTTFSNVIPIRQLYFSENFETFNPTSLEPIGWTQDVLYNPANFPGPNWQSKQGGFGSPDVVGSRTPDAAKSGTYNVRLVNPSSQPYIVMLKPNPINLGLSTKPFLTFYHAQVEWDNLSDSLGVYYKLGSTGTWKFLRNYTLATDWKTPWVKRTIVLPDEVINDNFYLGFKGTAQYGWGVCIDSIKIFETGIENRFIKSIVTRHPNLGFVPQSATKNPILRVNVKVKGNQNALILNSLTVTSGNTNDNDISALGVRLYTTSDSVFDLPKQIGTGQTFAAGKVTFGSLNKKIESGDNYFWVTYDVNSNANPFNILDASINAGDMSISGVAGSYPATIQSPAGNRIVKQSVFFDDFETDKLWGLSSQFQRGTPMGKGGANGRSDPSFAYSNSNVIGNDLSFDGDYSTNLTYATADTATSPIIEAKYFKNTQLSFYRWLNVGTQDSAIVEYKYAGESAWRFLWGAKNNSYQESKWTLQEFNSSTIIDRKNLRIRFRLGPTGNFKFSGWNIDYFYVTGDSVKYDIGVSKFISPKSASGLTANEYLKVRVKNTGPKTLSNIPIKASVDGGKHWITNTIAGPILVDDSIDYQFTTATDLSRAGIYDVIVKTAYLLDNYSKNDSVLFKLTSIPTYTLPYKTGFEEDTVFWTSGGVNSSWLHGTPNVGIINSPGEGVKSWKTSNWDNEGYYNLNENSYVESPTFNFTGNVAPIIDFKNAFNTQFKADGAHLEYSINGGGSWLYVPGDTSQFSWPWYNDTVQSLSSKMGWTGLVGGSVQSWQRSKHYFPELYNQANVVFRFVFKSDNPPVISRRAGFAFDDFRLYNAPYDVGVKSIDNLVTPSCQFGITANPNKVSVTVQNYGIRDVQQNDTIIIGFKCNNQTVIDTFKLSSSIPIGGTQVFTMKKAIDIVLPQVYNIMAFTMIEKDVHFYNTNNDTAKLTLVVNPNPVAGIPDTLNTNRPQKAIIQANHSTDYDYDWVYPKTAYTQHNPDYLEVKNTGLGLHLLTVTNKISLCTTADSTYVKLLISDIGVNKVISPITSCGYGTNMNPIVIIKNFGTDTLNINDTIPLRLILDGGAEVKDTLFLSRKLIPGDTIRATLSKTSLSLANTSSHTLSISTAYPADTTSSNDEIPVGYRNFQIYGYPTVDLGPDVFLQKARYSIRPIAKSGVTSYKWSDGNTTDSMVVTKSGKYFVTVANSNGCETIDSVTVRLKIHDLGVKKLAGPLSTCTLPNDTAINMVVTNFGTDTIYTTETIQMRYRINDTAFYTQPCTILKDLWPGDTLIFIFNKKVNLKKIAANKIMVAAILTGDIRTSNDSIVETVQIFGFPKPDLGPDKIATALTHTLDPGIGYAKYLWQDGSTASTYVISRENNNNPSTKYKVTVTDVNGCSAKDSVNIFLKVYDLEITSIEVDNACTKTNKEAISLKITNLGMNANVDNYIDVKCIINNNDTLIANFKLNLDVTKSYVYTFSKKVNMSAIGSYKIKASLTYGFDVAPTNDTLSKTVNVYGYPVISLADTVKGTLPVTLDAGAGIGYAYLWNTNATTQTILANADGLYKVDVTLGGICTSTKSVIVNNYTGIGLVSDKAEMTIYPNPVRDILNMQLTLKKTEDVIVQIYSADGKMLMMRQLSGFTQYLEQISVNALNSGIYYIRVSSNNWVVSEMVVVE